MQEPVTSPSTTWLRRGARDLVPKWGVLATLVIAFSVFCALRPDTFATVDNVTSMLRDCAPLAIAAFGLTIVMVMNDFDLSIGGAISAGSAVAVSLMSADGVAWPLAVLIALVFAIAVGLTNGLLVAFGGASSFIITLAMGTVLQGVQYLIDDQQQIFSGVPAGFANIASGELLGLSNQTYIAAGVFVLIVLLLELSEPGRYMYAIGANREAARLSGIPVGTLRTAGFVGSAVCAVVAGLLISSQSSSHTPDIGAPLILPAFAAAFLGTAVLRPGKFNIVGTLIGVLLLQVVSTGLVLLDLSTAIISIVQGVILIVAVLITVVARRR
jgi:ribose transport system permease protein